MALSDTENTLVLPVTINFERVFDIDSIVGQMTGKKPGRHGLLSLRRKLTEQKGHRLGRIYINFGKPLDIKDSASNPPPPDRLCHALVHQSLSLAPVSLNSVICALILHHKDPMYPLATLTQHATAVFEYLRSLNISSLMTIPPTAESIARVIKALGIPIFQTGPKAPRSVDLQKVKVAGRE